jgi:hypothetical protein
MTTTMHEKISPPIIDIHDHCDRSPSEPAVVLIQLTPDPASTIVLCGHHFDVNFAALISLDPFWIVDTRA